LTCNDLIGNAVDSRQTRRTLSVNSTDWNAIRNASVECCHARSGCTTTRRKNVADLYITDQCRVKANFRVCSSEDGRKDFFGAGILEATFLTLWNAASLDVSGVPDQIVTTTHLCHRRTYRIDDDYIVIILLKDLSLCARGTRLSRHCDE
jgi:hypothetical protein